MTKLLAFFCSLTGILISLLMFPDGATAVLVALACSIVAVAVIRRQKEDTDFLLQIFLSALLVRIVLATFINVFALTGFFGGDAETYDSLGYRLVEIWTGLNTTNDYWSQRAVSIGGSGWGMNYLVGGVYWLVGRNPLAIQFITSVMGAATAVLIYFCSQKIFNNRRVSRTAAIAVAFFPSMVIWSSNLLKDGPTVFLLVLAMVNVLYLLEKFSYTHVILLILALVGILSLRFYIFYMVAGAVVGSFIIGINNSPKAIIGRGMVIVLVGLSLTYFGVINSAATDFEKFGNLEALQRSRLDLATSANSGFEKDVDISTTEGAVAFLPKGFLYLMLAPFPWSMNNFRQAITLPEMVVWWASLPLLATGLWYTIKNRLRGAASVLFFTFMLTISYSIFQGNVGTAYRQRAQIQVFLFIFIAAGLTLLKEKKENKLMSTRMGARRF